MTDTELSRMVDEVATTIDRVAAGDVTATDTTDTDTWGLPGEQVTIFDWAEAHALEVYADGRYTPLTGWLATDYGIAVTLGGPDIRVIVDLATATARVEGRWGTDTATRYLTDIAAHEVEAVASESLPWDD